MSKCLLVRGSKTKISNVFSNVDRTELEKEYGTFSESLRLDLLQQTKDMFYHG